MAAVYGEERVNYYTNDHQYGAQVAVLAGGGYVVSWVSRGQDGSDDGIYAQRYNSVGMPVGAEFRVNGTTVGAQIQPAIASLSDGGFVIAWSDQYADGSSWGVFAQRYDALGVAQGSQFPINQTTLYDQGTPAIAAAGGGFVVTWASQYQDDGGSYGVYARRFAGDGSPNGGEFLVNTTLSSNQNEPAIAALPAETSSSRGAPKARTAAAVASMPSASMPPAPRSAASSGSTPPLTSTRPMPMWRCSPTAASS